MKSLLTILSVILFIGLSSCDQTTTQTTTTVTSSFKNSGVIQELIQVSNYTYCLVKEGSEEYWIAVAKMPVKEGQTLYFDKTAEMINFNSKELDRTFPSIYFIAEASTNPNVADNQQQMMTPQKPEIVKNKISVKKAEGGITIAELFANKDKYAGKVVKIKGEVTKFNPEIMNKNWIHIQDGTESDGNFDLTVTTLDNTESGEVVTCEGIIVLNKDFGAGYSYAVIMEEAKLVK
jgi:hypothetical protein